VTCTPRCLASRATSKEEYECPSAIWSRDAARCCPGVRVLRVDGIDRSERSASFAERSREDQAANPRHGTAARLSSRRVCAFAASASKPDGWRARLRSVRSVLHPDRARNSGGLRPNNYLPLLMDAQTQRGFFDSYLQMILERRAEGVIVIASWCSMRPTC